MVNVRAHEIRNRSLSTVAEMRRMGDDSKGTIIALLLELLRIELNNPHIKAVVDYLGQAVTQPLIRLASASTYAGYLTRYATTASSFRKNYLANMGLHPTTYGTGSTGNHLNSFLMQCWN
jgi:hypothetical protein